MIPSIHRDGLAAGSPTAGSRTCHHFPPCPAATAPDRHAARTIATHPEQGWSLLCNRVVLFDDNDELFPDGCMEAYAKLSLRKNRPIAVRNEEANVFSGLL